jgi:hypothetical protein
MSYQEILNKVAKELNIPLEVVKSAYESYWEFVRKTIVNLPLKEDLSEEEFHKLRTNFNIPSLGKLTCTYDRMIGVKKRFEYINKIRNDKRKED